MYRLIAMVAVAVLPATASELWTQANVGFQGVSGAQTGTVSASIPTTSTTLDSFNETVLLGATARAGYLGWGTSATFATSLLFPSQTDGGSTAYSESLDFVTPGGWLAGSSGKLLLDFTISGANSAVLLGDPAQSNSAGNSAASNYSLLAACAVTIFDSLPEPCGSGSSVNLGSASYTNLPIQLELDIVSGQPIGLEVYMSSTSTVHFDRGYVVNFSGFSDFSHTVTLTSVTLLDSNNHPVSNPTLTSQAGVIYPLNGTPVLTPEPSAMTLLAAGLAMLGWRVSRNRCVRGMQTVHSQREVGEL